ncbi:MAG TPA: hypothetical protein DCG28_02270 [Lachnospiraceae bacterium]|nr:hypothetical protein [Lachnospiraceae bacterium]
MCCPNGKISGSVMNKMKTVIKKNRSALLFAFVLFSLFLAICAFGLRYRLKGVLPVTKGSAYAVVPREEFTNEKGNRISGLEYDEKSGTLTATGAECFIVIGDRDILDSVLKTITLNISDFGDKKVETKLYLLDTYQRYDFELHNGECTVQIKPGSNDGKNPVLIRIDLPLDIGDSIKVESVSFNEPVAFQNAVKVESENIVGKLLVPTAFLLSAVFFLFLGKRSEKPLPDVYITLLGSGLISVFLHLLKAPQIFVLLFSVISAIAFFEILFYFFTKYVTESILKLKFINVKHICVTLLAVGLYMLFFVNNLIFFAIVLYSLYLVGRLCNVKTLSAKKTVVACVCATVSAVILFFTFAAIPWLKDIFGSFNGNGARAYYLAGSFYAALCACLLYFASCEKEFIKNGIKGIGVCLPFAVSSAFASLYGEYSSLSLFLTFAFGGIIEIVLLLRKKEDKQPDAEDKQTLDFGFAVNLSVMQLIFIALTVFFEVMVKAMLCDMSSEEIGGHLKEFVFSPVFIYNILLLNLCYGVITSLIGRGIGNIIFFLVNVVFFVFNYVKLRYHDTMFHPGDLMQIKDAWAIAMGAITVVHTVLIVICLLFVLFALYLLRKHLKPSIALWSLVVFLSVTAVFCRYTAKEGLADIGITPVDKWLDDEIRMDRQGFYMYTYLNSMTIFDIIPRQPAGYGQEYMAELKREFDSMHNVTYSEQKPDVIMLMLESAFDVESVPGVTLNEEVEENIKKYKKCDLISPRYGGGTANIEFEALTGLSTYFMEDSVVPYVTYWNSEDAYIPGLARQFEANGYDTVAIHPNDEDFYNRKTVYSAMGFDDFVSIEDMPSDIKRNKRGYVYNSEMLNIMYNLIEADESTPLFMFALNIENHNPYDKKDADAKVEATGDNLSENDETELSVYAQSLKSDDKMIGEIIDYMNKTTRPTLLYVWGDHLPGISYLSTGGYINDINNKYTTPIVAYSNYKELEPLPEKITPNQLAVQTLKDAQIEYDSYFDYIYSLRNDHPVIQREFISEEDERLSKYRALQYDILFGNSYIANRKE